MGNGWWQWRFYAVVLEYLAVVFLSLYLIPLLSTLHGLTPAFREKLIAIAFLFLGGLDLWLAAVAGFCFVHLHSWMRWALSGCWVAIAAFILTYSVASPSLLSAFCRNLYSHTGGFLFGAVGNALYILHLFFPWRDLLAFGITTFFFALGTRTVQSQ